MAWNRPTSNTVDATSSSRPSGRGKMPRLRKGLLAGAIVVLGAGFAAWLLTNGEATSSSLQKKDRGLIKEVAPAATPTNALRKVRMPKPEADRNADFIRKCEAKYGANMPAGLKTHIYYLKNPPQQTYAAIKAYPYLENQAEREIASVLYCEPGTFFVEPPTFDAKFDQHFANAVASPIEIKPDDPEDVKAVKSFVTDMKKQIAAILKEEGKKPSELMTEQGQLMYDLGRFEEQLAENLREAEKNPNMSDADVKDLFAAANVLRKKKGLPERRVPTLATRALDLRRKLRKEAHQARKQAAEAAEAGRKNLSEQGTRK